MRGESWIHCEKYSLIGFWKINLRKIVKNFQKIVGNLALMWYYPYCCVEHSNKREWLSGGASPCQGEGRGFDSRLALLADITDYVYLCNLSYC